MQAIPANGDDRSDSSRDDRAENASSKEPVRTN